jgi:hypothetical protein
MMRARNMILLLAIPPLALGACKKNQKPQDENIAIDQPVTNETLANADVEMLPPDESSTDSSNELATGTDNLDVNDVNASGNSQ